VHEDKVAQGLVPYVQSPKRGLKGGRISALSCANVVEVQVDFNAGRTLTVEAADATWRIYDEDGLVAEVARTTTKPVGRFKVHKPEPPRRSIASTTGLA